MKLKIKYKLFETAKYNNLLKCLDEAICANYELRKTCQCRHCRWYQGVISQICQNTRSNYYNEHTSRYNSCEKCERR